MDFYAWLQSLQPGMIIYGGFDDGPQSYVEVIKEPLHTFNGLDPSTDLPTHYSLVEGWHSPAYHRPETYYVVVHDPYVCKLGVI